MTLNDSLAWLDRCQRCRRQPTPLNARGLCPDCAHDDAWLALQGAVFFVVSVLLVVTLGWGLVRLVLWIAEVCT